MNKKGVRSDQGFEVQFTGRFTAEYREGVRYLIVDLEGNGSGQVAFSDKALGIEVDDALEIAEQTEV
jgi:hypothetical protein